MRADTLLPRVRIVSGARTDEDDAGGRAGLRKLGIFRQEPIPRMDRIHTRFPRDSQDVINEEVCFDRPLIAADEIGFVRFGPMQREAIFLRIDRDRTQAELRGGSHDPDGDLATVGDQNTAYPLRHLFFHPGTSVLEFAR